MSEVKKAPISIILIIVFTELILGGLGHLFYLPIRLILFVSVILYTIYDITKVRKIFISKKILINIILVGLLISIIFMVSIIKGNNIMRSIDYLQVYISVLYIPIFQQLLRNNVKNLEYLVELFIKYIYWLSLVTITLVLFSYFAHKFGIDVLKIFVDLKTKTNYGFITGYLYDNQICRVYFANGIFMQIAVAILLFKIVNKVNDKGDYKKVIIICISIIASNTRGYWIGLAIVVMIMLIINKKKIKMISLILISTIILCISMEKIGVMDEMVSRIKNITNFSTEISNIQRAYQMEVINAGIKDNPILGHGVGSEIKGYYQLTGRDSNDVELFYNELIYKIGFLGFLIYILIIIRLVIIVLFIRKKELNSIQQSYLCGWGVGLISVMVTSATNPYLKGANGFFAIVMFFLMYNIFFIGKK